MTKAKDTTPQLPEPPLNADQSAAAYHDATMKVWRKIAPNESKRPGGYYLSSNGIPVDANGNVIPEAEWTEEHGADIRARYPDTPVEKLRIWAAGGADIHPKDGGGAPPSGYAFPAQPLQGIVPRPPEGF